MKKTGNVFLKLIVIFLLFFCVYVFLGPFSRISLVDVSIDEKLKTDGFYIKEEREILSYLENYRGQFLWQVDLKDLVEKTNAFYLGLSAYAARRFPNRLTLVLKKKRTALLLLRNGGDFFSVSDKGEMGGERNPEESFDFPILRGELFWEEAQLRERALSILSSIPEKGPFFSVQNVSEISYNETNDSLLFYLISGPFILELKKQVQPKKMKNINFVLNYLIQKDSQKGFIDARLDKKIIVKHLD